MQSALQYNTIQKPSVAEFKDRGSHFIAYAYPVKTTDDCKNYLQTVKKEHPKAAHYCFAYKLGTDGNLFRVSDAGEPSGTAGKPILGQIDSKQLVDVMVIVVRYFGGTLLGVPGLINAYKTAAALALQLTPIVQKQVLLTYRLQFDYTKINDVMMVLKQFGCEVQKQESSLFWNVEVAVPRARISEIEFKLKDLLVEVTPVNSN